MDSEKLESSSDSSKEESSDRSSNQLKEDDLDSFANKRFYGCIFCKRGFSSAQALGGHMNIHKKDRANKAKQNTSFSSSILENKQIDQSKAFMNTHYFEPLMVRSQVSYEPSVSNPHGYFHELSDLSMNLWGSDLSLQIKPSKERNMGLFNGEGVDLELRLGHDP